METSRNTRKLAQYSGNKPQHNKISTTQWKQATMQQNWHNTMETSHNKTEASYNTTKLAQHYEISHILCVVAISLCSFMS